MRFLVLAVVLLGCGRIGYDAIGPDAAHVPAVNADGEGPIGGDGGSTPAGAAPDAAALAEAAQADAQLDASPLDAQPDAPATDRSVSDQSGSEASSPDAPPADGASDGALGPTSCGQYATSFCSGYEFDYPATLGEWSYVLGDASGLATTTERVRFGTRSLRVSMTGTGNRDALGNTFLTVNGTEVYARTWVYLGRAETIDAISIMALLNRSGIQGLSVVVTGGDTIAIRLEMMSTTTIPTMGVLPRDRWVCVRFHATMADVGGSVDVEVDGTRYGPFTGYDTYPSAGLSNVYGGLNWVAPTQPPITIYFDDIAVGATPIPCQ